MSPTLLSTRLKQLVKAGVVERSGKKGSNSYCLTEAGKELRPIVELLGAWGHRWVRSNLNTGELDAGLLMWDMRRSIDASVFPAHRVVVQFEYLDAPKGARIWWLVSENGEIDLCLDDPGHDVDILIKSSLATMTAVWTCQVQFKDMVNKGSIQVLGEPTLTNKLQGWLCTSLLSKLGTLDKLPNLDWNIR